MVNLLRYLNGLLRNERGAEMVEWVVVVVILAVIAAIVFGPEGVLNTALQDGINSISDIIQGAAAQGPDGG